MSAHVKTGAWTEDEDELLTKYQRIYGNRWSQISQHIPGRNGQQCAQRWRHKVNPNIVKDKWTPEEDSILCKLVQELGVGRWASVARHLPGRTDQQCMGRWRRHLDPNIRKDAWTEEEDAQLGALYQEHGSAWSLIAKFIPNRTPQQCRGRWCVLNGGKTRVPVSSEEPQQERVRSTRKGVGAKAVVAAGSARQGQGQTEGCPSANLHSRPATETPAMPASALAPCLLGGEGPLPQTALKTRSTSAPKQASSATVSEQATPAPAGTAPHRRGRHQQAAANLQDTHDSMQPGDERKVATACQHSSVKVVRKGRLLLGNRLVSFWKRARTTKRTARAKVPYAAAFLGLACADVSAPAQAVSGAAAAVVSLSPPHSAAAVPFDETNEAAGPRSLLDEAAAAGTREGHSHAAMYRAQAPAACAEVEVDKICTEAVPELPATGVGSCSAKDAANVEDDTRTREATRRAGDSQPCVESLVLSPRKTRSGRRYPLSTVSGSARTRRRGQAAASVVPSRTSDAEVDANSDNMAAADTQQMATAATRGCVFHPPVDAAVPVSRQDGDSAGRSLPSAVGAVDELLNATSSQLRQVQGDQPEGQASGIDLQSSLGLPDDLLMTAQATPSGSLTVNWQQVVGSPPTSSLLALLQAGLLRTPSCSGRSPSSNVLCAPVPPGMPKVEPGISNGWSDVPALSWSSWRRINASFGVLGCPAPVSSQATPDNTRPRARASQGVQGDNYTPSRDAYVHSDWQQREAASWHLLQQDIPEGTISIGAHCPLWQDPVSLRPHPPGLTDSEVEGQGATFSRSASPVTVGVHKQTRRSGSQIALAGETGFSNPPGVRAPSLYNIGAPHSMAVNAAPGHPPASSKGQILSESPLIRAAFACDVPSTSQSRGALGAHDGSFSGAKLSYHLLAKPQDGNNTNDGRRRDAAGRLAPSGPQLRPGLTYGSGGGTGYGNQMAAMGAVSPLTNAAMTLAPEGQQITSVQQFMLPPALASALLPLQAADVNSAHAPPAQDGHAAIPAERHKLAPYSNLYGNFMGMPAATLQPPRLAPPKIPPGEPNQRRITSLFPVLTLNSVPSGK